MNLTVKEYLELMRGPQQISHEIVIPITIVYIIIFVTGVIGNVIVCLVVVRNANFQTPTNYYLFSLAISDLLILLFGLPNDLQVYWQQYPWLFGETVCKVRAFIAEMTSYASVLTIVAFSTERYLAICHPLLIQTVSSLSRAIKIITTAWVTSCLCAIPFAFFTQVNYLKYPNSTGSFLQESAFCSLPMDNNDVSLPLVQFSSFVFFCLPMTLIVIIYVKIGIKVRKSRFSRLPQKSGDSSNSNRLNAGMSQPQPQVDNASEKGGRIRSFREGKPPTARRSINKMLVAVVIAFFVCWAPFHTQRLFACFFDPNEWTRALRQLNEILYYTGGCLYYFSATINPILYSLMSARYREAFRDALCLAGSKLDRQQSKMIRYSHRPSDTCVIVADKDIGCTASKTAIVVARHDEGEPTSINGVCSAEKDHSPNGNGVCKAEPNGDPPKSTLLVTFRDALCQICSRRPAKAITAEPSQKGNVPVIKITSSSSDSSSVLKNKSPAETPKETQINEVTNVDDVKSASDNAENTQEKVQIFRETPV